MLNIKPPGPSRKKILSLFDLIPDDVILLKIIDWSLFNYDCQSLVLDNKSALS